MKPQPSSTYLILVVDDEPAFCTVLSEILRLYGYVVHQAHSAEQALKLLEEAMPDLVVTDVMMPDVDGLTLIRRIRSNTSWAHIPTVVVTARALPDQLANAKRAGANACLSKPFTAQDLRQVIEPLLPTREA